MVTGDEDDGLAHDADALRRRVAEVGQGHFVVRTRLATERPAGPAVMATAHRAVHRRVGGCGYAVERVLMDNAKVD